MEKVIFLDRDGTLNVEVNYLHRKEDLVLLPGVRCHCRKPETGMFEMAEQDFAVDKASSWMIGDKLIDMEAGRNYGVRTVLVGTGYGAGVHEEQKKKGDFPYDLYADDLLEAYNEINRETAGNL